MLDIVVPCLKQDHSILERSLCGIFENVEDGVGNVFILSDSIDGFDNILSTFGNKVSIIDEKEVIGYLKDDVVINNSSRKGWVYQQLLKLSSDKIVSTDNFLAIDADHVLIKPHRFVDGDKFNFYTSKEFHKPYFNCIDKLFGGKYQKEVNESFISDKMVFNKSILSSMKSEIEENHGCSWDKGIFKCYDNTSYCGFSEFETYGTYFKVNYNEKMNLIPDERFMYMYRNLETMDYNTIKDNFKQFKSVTLFRLAK